MKTSFYFSLLLALCLYGCKTSTPIPKTVTAQSESIPSNSEVEKNPYRESYLLLFELIHTRINIFPDFETSTIPGEAQLRVRPYFYSSDLLTLDAKRMEIHAVQLLSKSGLRKDLVFNYDSLQLKIHLGNVYSRLDTLEILVQYTAHPEKLRGGGSLAIQEEKGFYFINPTLKDPYKPRQFWTQGETESNSVWFPTIEGPQQRMSQEIQLRVPNSLTTISNGLKTVSQFHEDGTRTDTWIQTQRLPVYLTMVAASNFAIIKQDWRGKEVSYYVDSAYAPYALLTFGKTPRMLDFFSGILNYPYPWDKYSQVVVHDYISGAMENNTAVIHGTNMHQDARSYLDDNDEQYISHELFHHWFGNLVTCESWAHITLNEGFANYGEYLWAEHEYGRDEADRINQTDQNTYLFVTSREDLPLIRYYYDHREDVYDVVSYHKGGRVLHMLRKYLGDDAFFLALQNYLKRHANSSTEWTDFRKACEEVCGEDLNWFFDQWYIRPGRPSLQIDYQWNDSLKIQTVFIEQTQKLTKNILYKLPLDVDFYFDNKKIRKRIVVEKQVKQQFDFAFDEQPEFVNVDAEKMLLCERKRDNKSEAGFIHQYYHAPLYLDRYEALQALGQNYRHDSQKGLVIREALKDPFWKIRAKSIELLGEWCKNAPDSVLPVLMNMAKKDTSPRVREEALKTLSKYYSYKELEDVFEQSILDSSYKVASVAFSIMADKDDSKALRLSQELEKESGRAILSALSKFYSQQKGLDKTEFYKNAIRRNSSFGRFGIIQDFNKYLKNNDEKIIEQGVEIFAQRAMMSTTIQSRDIYINQLKSMETELQTRISRLEKEIIEKRSDSSQHHTTIPEQQQMQKAGQVILRINDIIDSIYKLN